MHFLCGLNHNLISVRSSISSWLPLLPAPPSSWKNIFSPSPPPAGPDLSTEDTILFLFFILERRSLEARGLLPTLIAILRFCPCCPKGEEGESKCFYHEKSRIFILLDLDNHGGHWKKNLNSTLILSK